MSITSGIELVIIITSKSSLKMLQFLFSICQKSLFIPFLLMEGLINPHALEVMLLP